MRDQYSAVGWLILHIVKKTQSQQIFNAFMAFLKAKVHGVFQELTTKEASLKTGE